MKNKKLNLVLNFAVICLCLATICFGVYSAKNASLNVSGTIGFNAHNCLVEVSGTYSCYEQETGAQITDSALWDSAFTVGGADSSNSQLSKSIDKVLTFSDLNGSPTSGSTSYEQQATIKLKIVNKSDFEVSVNTSKPTFTNSTTSQYVKTGVDVSEITLGKTEECYITYTFTITISADTIEINSVNGGYSIDISFNKSTSSDNTVPTNLYVVNANVANINQSWFDEKKKTYEGIKITNGATFAPTQGNNIELNDFVIVCESGEFNLDGVTLTLNTGSYILMNGAVIESGTIYANVSNAIRIIDSTDASTNEISECTFNNQFEDSTMFYIKNSKLTLTNCMMSDGSKKFNIQLKNGSELYLENFSFDSTLCSFTKDSSSKYYIDGEEK